MNDNDMLNAMMTFSRSSLHKTKCLTTELFLDSFGCSEPAARPGIAACESVVRGVERSRVRDFLLFQNTISLRLCKEPIH